MDERNFVDERNFEIETWLQLAIKLFKSMKKSRILLAYNNEESKIENGVACAS